MTNETLTHERNIFITIFFGTIGFNLVCSFILYGTTPDPDLNVTLTVFMKIACIYAAFRLSRFLKQPRWLTVLYCILIVSEIIYLIPLISLLIAVKNKRKTVNLNACNSAKSDHHNNCNDMNH